MAFTKINAAGIGTTETVTVDGLTVINDGSFGGNLTVSGVLTYEDVTNVDSVGLITARNGIVVGSGITLSKDGDIFATGITTVSGNVKVGTGITLSPDGDGFFTGVITATSYYGDGSNLSNITSTTINNNADNRLITGSGTANTLNGESTLTYDGTNLDLNDDSKKLRFGAGQDLEIYHDGSTNIFDAATSSAISFRRGGSEQFFIGNAEFKGGDDKKIKLGTGDDLQIYHAAGAASHINATGLLNIDGTTGVRLEYNNSTKLETTTDGIQVTGAIFASGKLDVPDNAKLMLGTGDDLQIYHDGSSSFITDTAGASFTIQATESIAIKTNNTEFAIACNKNGSVELYHDNTLAAQTSNLGFAISGDKTLFIGSAGDFRIGHDGTSNFLNSDGSQSIRIQMGGSNHWEFASNLFKGNDGKKITLGDSSDLQIFHDGTYNYIDCVNGKQLRIVNDTQGGNELMIKANPNGAVELYNNGVKQINTHPNGIFVRGIYPMSDNSFSIGSSTERFHTVYATQGINSSDRNQKNTIIESDLGLDFVNKLKPVSYKWNEDDGKTHYGLIAQEVEETVIDIGKTVSDFGAIDKPDGDPMGLSYNEFISPLIKAVQELTAKNDALEARIKTLEG